MMNIDTEGLVRPTAQQIVEWHAAIFGMTGSGKTNFMRVFAEELANDGTKVTIIDPEGDYGALRKGPKTLIVGRGKLDNHIDIPLNPDNAAAAADVLSRYDIPVVILDISGFDILTRVDFVVSYVGQLWKNYQFERLPPHRLFVDEVQIFAPQGRQQDGQADSRFLFQDIIARGRKNGLTLAFATQRPQKVDTGLRDETHIRVFLALARGKALDAVKDLLPSEVMNAGNKQVGEMIASFERGDAIYMVGNHAKKIKVRASDFDPKSPIGSAPVQLPLDDSALERLKMLISENKIAEDIKAEVKSEVLESSIITALKADNEALRAENERLKAENQRLTNEAVGTVFSQAASALSGKPTPPPLPKKAEVSTTSLNLANSQTGNGVRGEVVTPNAAIQERDEARQRQARERELQRQKTGYSTLLWSIKNLKKADQKMLSFLVDHPDKEFSNEELILGIGYSATTSHSPIALVTSNLVDRRQMAGGRYVYKAKVLQTIAKNYPLIAETQAIEDIARYAR